MAIEKLFTISINDDTVCYAKGELNAKLVSQAIYMNRGFFVMDFSEPTIAVEGPITTDIRKGKFFGDFE
jgi:hypothetical protein